MIRSPYDLRDLVATSHRTRLHAARTAPADAALVLRRVLYSDAHAEVRATAARRLATLALEGSPGIEAWLLDALADGSPLVRDAILRALARCGSPAAVAPLRAIVAEDRMWWVRRAAVYTLAAIAGADELATFQAVLADPFWRVRHAAVRVLTVLGARDLDVRHALSADEPSPANAIAFLRASWGPAPIEAPQRAASATSQLPAALLDPDPAVVTARLADDPDVTPMALVELLCDPHAPLRLLAVDRLVASRDRDALIAALDWLEAFKIPHVADLVEGMLDGLGDDAIAIAEHALARPERRGGVRWAIHWVAATGYEPLFATCTARAGADRGLRAGALPIAEIDELLAWAADETTEDGLAVAIAAELASRREDDALLALLDDAPRIRALQLDAAGRSGDFARLRGALADPHHAARAVATRYLVHAGELDGTVQLADPDPAVREAALTAGNAASLVGDRDPFVARAAIDRLARAHGFANTIPAEAIAAAITALADRDPFVRARACVLAIHDRAPATLARIVELLGDRDDAVRAGAVDALERGADLTARLVELVATPLPDRVRTLAYAWLLRDLDDATGELAREALVATSERSPRTRALLAAIGGVATPTIEILDVDEDAPPASTAPVAKTERRPFGRVGFDVAPLAISGAFDLSPGTLQRAASAGANLFFWEPGYHGLTQFLRTRDAERARVIAGSYHAEPAAIEADVDRARRLLKRDTLDVFLLFWSRSSARIDADAYDVLDRLKRAGKIRAAGFSTHFRELARDAIAESPWDVVMIRHSAAHPGIESVLLPAARAAGTAIVTFSALCYGRMLSGPNAPSAADCYRYSVSQPGVVACISAPRRDDEVDENVAVLRTPLLSAERLAELRAHGVGVRAENQRFNTLVRQPTRDAAAAARELLAAELPPAEVIEDRPLPRAGMSRGARTHLGRARRGHS